MKKKIKYSKITKEQFNEFLVVLKEVNIGDYKDEQMDNFHGLYKYWNNKSIYYFEQKLIKLKSCLQKESKDKIYKLNGQLRKKYLSKK